MTKKIRKFSNDYDDDYRKKPKQSNDRRKNKALKSALHRLDVDSLEDIVDEY